MQLQLHSPGDLRPNPWNSNRLTPEAELKLENSVRLHGMFKPIVARTLADGTLEILGGEHRAQAAQRLGMAEIPVVNLGRLSDEQAKTIGILDNGRYGHDDADALARLLEELGDPAELAAFMPFDTAEIDAMARMTRLDLDRLGLDEEGAAPIEDKIARAPKTHVTMRFRVGIENQAMVEDAIKSVVADQGLDDSDALVNAGDALVWIVRRLARAETP